MTYVLLWVLMVHQRAEPFKFKNRFFQTFQLGYSVEYCKQTTLSLVELLKMSNEMHVRWCTLLSLIYFVHISLHYCLPLSVFRCHTQSVWVWESFLNTGISPAEQILCYYVYLFLQKLIFIPWVNEHHNISLERIKSSIRHWNCLFYNIGYCMHNFASCSSVLIYECYCTYTHTD